jgi:hypothetical protein
MTGAEMRAALALVAALADAIRDLGRVPAGHLYAGIMDRMSLESFNRAVEIMKAAGLVRESNHELIWVGPELRSPK